MKPLGLSAVVLVTMCLYLSSCGGQFVDELNDEEKWPTVGVSILVRNKAHSLPAVLTYLEKQEYPKQLIIIWFFVDNTSDRSLEIISKWIEKYKSMYNKIVVNSESGPQAPGTNKGEDIAEWTEERLKHIIKLREKALKVAKQQGVDYIFMLDADVLLTEPKLLQILIEKKLPIVAPMLISDGLYSNFWAAMSKKYYYERSEQYAQIINREIEGCFEVPMVHSVVLVDLQRKQSAVLTYDPAKVKGYDGPADDIIAFALSARFNGIPMSVCNDLVYGFIPIPIDMSDKSVATTETQQFVNVKIEALARGVTFPLDPDLAEFVTYPPKDRLGTDRVFMINLERREDRRRLMDLSFKELGVEYTLFKAFDGGQLDMKNLSDLGVTLMPNYEDPFHKRPMKAGEVGCFLSHFHIWKEIAKRNIKVSLILEDDIHFTPFFRLKFQELMKDLKNLDWEFVYIGRKVLQDAKEELVTPRLSRPLYSYWTLGYLLSEDGARKLLRAEPIAKMLPVDEFLPIMFDQHPNDTWKAYFPRRDLKAFSASPVLIHPTHYTGQDGYVSDTEDSRVLSTPARGPSTPASEDGTL